MGSRLFPAGQFWETPLFVATALLFERDKVGEVDDWEGLVDRLHRSSILWIDLGKSDVSEVQGLSESLELDSASMERLSSTDDEPFFGDFGSYLHVNVYAPSADARGTDFVSIDCIVSKRWLVTVHSQDVDVIENFRRRAVDGTGDTGHIDGLEFLATLLEWVLNAYLEAFDRIEDDLGEFDARVLDGRLEDPDTELRRLVELRREIRGLRKALVSHREMFLALTRPELEAIASSSHAERFESLRSRLEDAIQGARDSRDSIVGSFDVLIARNEQRQNEVMKVLTLASVLFLPGALLAGVLGMNFKVGFFDHASLFWVVVAIIAGMIVATLLAARLRKWI